MDFSTVLLIIVNLFREIKLRIGLDSPAGYKNRKKTQAVNGKALTIVNMELELRYIID